jgi:high-affinity K+ transport system ATPase subunit B
MQQKNIALKAEQFSLRIAQAVIAISSKGGTPLVVVKKCSSSRG